MIHHVDPFQHVVHCRAYIETVYDDVNGFHPEPMTFCKLKGLPLSKIEYGGENAQLASEHRTGSTETVVLYGLDVKTQRGMVVVYVGTHGHWKRLAADDQ